MVMRVKFCSLLGCEAEASPCGGGSYHCLAVASQVGFLSGVQRAVRQRGPHPGGGGAGSSARVPPAPRPRLPGLPAARRGAATLHLDTVNRLCPLAGSCFPP